MEPSIFKMLVDQYQTPHPLLGVDGQAFPMIPYSMKQELLQNAGASQGLTMDDLVNMEAKRVKQLLDAAYANGDSQLSTRILNELYPLMVEDIESGNHKAVAVYSPVVNQMRYIIGITQQPQPQPVAQEMGKEPVQEPEQVDQTKPAAQEMREEPLQAPKQVDLEEPIAQEPEPVALENEPVAQESQAVVQESKPAQSEQKSTPAKARRKKRTPASSIVLFILGFAFILAFLLINALPLIGVGTYEELDLMGLIDIAIGCVVLGLVCCVIAAIILWRSKKA